MAFLHQFIVTHYAVYSVELLLLCSMEERKFGMFGVTHG